MADATTTETTSDGSRKGGLVIALAIALACVVALLAGLVAAAGPARLSALISGTDAQEGGSAVHTDVSGHGAAPGPASGASSYTQLMDMPKQPENIIVLPFQEIIVNITATTATGRQTSRFLKLNLALVYDNALPGAATIETRQLFMRDSFQDYLRQLNESDLQGSIGIARLKGELLRRARAITDSEAPQEFLIADLIIQ
ncbi:flagellar basal body-associated FliL family protein [Yangia mangrovi]|uniref:Flagellar protein FliL n=1 Tax=Alloyangia mangrovi TaxID=1779329 RepID=A0A2A3JNC5_9RHOB|nr:flagellar basal body-associated FliL family protein [Alloyangia mangrovi]MCA0942312.1 flagellar basal body-associated FliL family protein [Alloyangia pacifica]MCA0947413.1 flagellar basal body-associated FliL family protein [Alloyangia pacifica]MCT4369506.1 flagellar basal body-associated FliL family protein [Alloyangia mangrovi]